QLVKITGLVSCGDISLISSYEKVENCVYTSTLLRKCGRWGSEVANPKNNCSRWKLTHAEVRMLCGYLHLICRDYLSLYVPHTYFIHLAPISSQFCFFSVMIMYSAYRALS
uniref:Uncharacterized protein n=1 Tax=Aegilops tauschii subsp. strangulata TaxID=200361 RepID=A0A453CJN2_AEGTS